MARSQIFGSGDSDDATKNGVAASATNVYYSKVFQLKNGRPGSIHVETTGTLAGTFTLWYSNKLKPNQVNDLAAHDGDWVQDIAFVPVNPAGAAVKFYTPIGNVVAMHVRLKYVNASGTGNLWGVAVTADGGS